MGVCSSVLHGFGDGSVCAAWLKVHSNLLYIDRGEE